MTKLEKLLAQVAAEKSRLAEKNKIQKAEEKLKAAKVRQQKIDEITALVFEAGLHEVDVNFLLPALQKVAADFAAKLKAEVNHG